MSQRKILYLLLTVWVLLWASTSNAVCVDRDATPLTALPNTTCNAQTNQCEAPARPYWHAIKTGSLNPVFRRCDTAEQAFRFMGVHAHCRSLGHSGAISIDYVQNNQVYYAATNCVVTPGVPGRYGTTILHRFECPVGFVVNGDGGGFAAPTCTKTSACFQVLTPINTLKDLHDDTDAQKTCTSTLEAGGNCNDQLTAALVTARNCLNAEFTRQQVPFNITSQFRTQAYQAHLLEGFNYGQRYATLNNQDKAICNQINSWHTPPSRTRTVTSLHGVVVEPADPDNTRHNTGRAFDISADNVNAYIEATTAGFRPINTPRPPGQPRVQPNPAVLNASVLACGLVWGGNWQRVDRVHFELAN